MPVRPGDPARLTPPVVCLVTDRRQLTPDARTEAAALTALEALIDDAIAEGIGMVQVREPDLAAASLAALVRRIVLRKGAAATLVLVNDRADVAIVASADGVHLRASSPPADRIRQLRPSWVLGRSVHAGEPRGLEDDVDYALFGTVFPSASKPAGHRAVGLDGLAAAVTASRAPVIAIGGIETPVQAAACARAGAIGVAGIRLFLPEGSVAGALGVRRAVRELTAAMAAAA
ncbi:MAG: thiamine phosphate synthase [Acidobacteria bacterium]|nr:thiamine phosphate synthase [Acidobacteriota bacterium]